MLRHEWQRPRCDTQTAHDGGACQPQRHLPLDRRAHDAPANYSHRLMRPLEANNISAVGSYLEENAQKGGVNEEE